VTSVTDTDVYFTYSGGIGNAKLKNLEPEWQKHFHFDAAKAGAAEKDQTEAAAQFRRNVLAEKADAAQKFQPPVYEDGDVTAPEIFAHSFRGQRTPSVIVDQWLTPPAPKPDGKFVLLFFWTTAAEPCRNIVPYVNELAVKYQDRLIVVGLSNEPAEEMRKMKSPAVNFYAGTDTQARSLRAYGVTRIPHLVLIDPTGIVRFEGPPIYLSEKDLEHLLATYAR
jgi:thiol-disulfide isomerase/thioredoxin